MIPIQNKDYTRHNLHRILYILYILYQISVSESLKARSLKYFSSEEGANFTKCLESAGIEINTVPDYVHHLCKQKDPKFYCLLQCEMEENGIIKDGKIDAVKAEEYLIETEPDAPLVVIQVMRKCVARVNSQQYSDECGITKAYADCEDELLDDVFEKKARQNSELPPDF